MVKVNRAEIEYLESKGCKWQTELHKTYSGHKNYYATESPKILRMLENYRKEHIVESH